MIGARALDECDRLGERVWSPARTPDATFATSGVDGGTRRLLPADQRQHLARRLGDVRPGTEDRLDASFRFISNPPYAPSEETTFTIIPSEGHYEDGRDEGEGDRE